MALKWTDDKLLPMEFGPDAAFMSREIANLFDGDAERPYGLDAYWKAVDDYQERMRGLKIPALGAMPVIFFGDGPSIPALTSKAMTFGVWNTGEDTLKNVVLAAVWRPSVGRGGAVGTWDTCETVASLEIGITPDVPGVMQMEAPFRSLGGARVMLLPSLGPLEGIGLKARVALHRPARRAEMPEFMLRCTWGVPVVLGD